MNFETIYTVLLRAIDYTFGVSLDDRLWLMWLESDRSRLIYLGAKCFRAVCKYVLFYAFYMGWLNAFLFLLTSAF